jgi:hypothetical protein
MPALFVPYSHKNPPLSSPSQHYPQIHWTCSNTKSRFVGQTSGGDGETVAGDVETRLHCSHRFYSYTQDNSDSPLRRSQELQAANRF